MTEMTEKPEEPDLPEEAGEEPSEGHLEPSPELQEALREAEEAVQAREAGHFRDAPQGGEPQTEPAEAESEGPSEAEALRAELEQTQDRLLRLQADFENHRRRALKDRQEAHHYGHENLVKDLLGTVDNLDRAIDHARGSGGEGFEAMLQGVELVQRELMGALAKHGVSEIEAGGVPFDPNVHEAMAQLESDEIPEGHVLQVLQKGYVLRERMLRPARVIVSKQPEKPQEEPVESERHDESQEQ